MVTARLAIGSVSTLALGALLLGSAPYWLHRGAAQATPWGAIASPGARPSGELASQDDKAKLLQLAALKSGATPEPAQQPVAVEPAPAPQPVAPPEPVPAVAAAPVPIAADPAPVQAASAEQAPGAQQAVSDQQVAIAQDPAAPDTEAKSAALVNINTAPVSALDHLPGAGRIGHTIVSHRPYKSVKDLVNKRVLRMSDFQKIQSRVSVD